MDTHGEEPRRESIDITSARVGADNAADNPPNTPSIKDGRLPNPADLSKTRAQRSRGDLIEQLFLASDKPNVALFAISICIAGVMDLLPRYTHAEDTWTERIEDVNSFYGPGVTISWCIMSMSMLYDANEVYKRKLDGFHYLKYASLMISSAFALGDAIWRALRIDFGPSYAAALYMSDKGFEVAVLLYMIQLFPIRRRRVGPSGKDVRIQNRDEEQIVGVAGPLQSIKEQAFATIARYKIFPCIPMVCIWVWCRALANGHTVYNVHAQNPRGTTITWEPLLMWYWKPILTVICLGLTTLISSVMRWGWRTWGLPVGILLSLAMLHSGLFGTSTPLRLTTVKITDLDQLASLISTVLLLIVQYGRRVALLRKVGKEFRTLVFGERD